MTRRCLLASLGIFAAPMHLVRPADARILSRHFDGELNLAGNTTPLSLKLTTSSGRNRLVTGQIWWGDDVHGVSGRFSRDRKKLTLAAGLPNNQELRLDGKCSERGALCSGRALLFADGAAIAGGSFSFRDVSTVPKSK